MGSPLGRPACLLYDRAQDAGPVMGRLLAPCSESSDRIVQTVGVFILSRPQAGPIKMCESVIVALSRSSLIRRCRRCCLAAASAR
jgi:hypothetical protein